jgi:hypothetical protein
VVCAVLQSDAFRGKAHPVLSLTQAPGEPASKEPTRALQISAYENPSEVLRIARTNSVRISGRAAGGRGVHVGQGASHYAVPGLARKGSDKIAPTMRTALLLSKLRRAAFAALSRDTLTVALGPLRPCRR